MPGLSGRFNRVVGQRRGVKGAASGTTQGTLRRQGQTYVAQSARRQSRVAQARGQSAPTRSAVVRSTRGSGFSTGYGFRSGRTAAGRAVVGQRFQARGRGAVGGRAPVRRFAGAGTNRLMGFAARHQYQQQGRGGQQGQQQGGTRQRGFVQQRRNNNINNAGGQRQYRDNRVQGNNYNNRNNNNQGNNRYNQGNRNNQGYNNRGQGQGQRQQNQQQQNRRNNRPLNKDALDKDLDSYFERQGDVSGLEAQLEDYWK